MENSVDVNVTMSSHGSSQPERVKNGKSFSSEGEKSAPEKQKKRNQKKMRMEKEALERGEQDQTTVAEISVMVYYTPEFKNFTPDPINQIKRQITFANLVFRISKIPVELSIFCIDELEGFIEDPERQKRLKDFRNAKKALVNKPDIEILMTGTPDAKRVPGLSTKHVPGLSTKHLAWVYPKNELTFLYILGQLFGCRSKREEFKDKSKSGYLMNRSHMNTIMSRTFNRIPRFSSKDQMYNRLPLGDSQNDNRSLIMRTRFLLTVGHDEATNCGHHNSTCAEKCPQNCCPKDKANVEVFVEDCQYCNEKIIIPIEDHYVIDVMGSLPLTCKNILWTREKEALEKGEQDQTTVAEVSVMVYYTPDFKIFTPDPVHHIKRQIAFANIVYSINDIPLNLSIFCIEELAIGKTNDWGIMLEYFSHAKKNLLNGASIAILMTGSGTKDRKYAVGAAYDGTQNKSLPLAWVYPNDMLTFIHEVGHIFGCHHNRDNNSKKNMNKSHYGYHMKGSKMRTIMAKETKNFLIRIPRFSSKIHSYNGVPLGDSKNDNRGQIMKTRFLLSQMGNETGNCGHHNDTCAKKCLQDCCPMKRGKDVVVFAEECQYCNEKIIKPFENHYIVVKNKQTCKVVWQSRKGVKRSSLAQSFFFKRTSGPQAAYVGLEAAYGGLQAA